MLLTLMRLARRTKSLQIQLARTLIEILNLLVSIIIPQILNSMSISTSKSIVAIMITSVEKNWDDLDSLVDYNALRQLFEQGTGNEKCDVDFISVTFQFHRW